MTEKPLPGYTKKDGLSSNYIMSILQDKKGNLWFGTDDGGVLKYDGKSFIHFTDKEGLSSNTVLSILQDKSGILWFGTDEGGVSKYDGKSFTHFTDNRRSCAITRFVQFYRTKAGIFGSALMEEVFSDMMVNPLLILLKKKD